MKSAVALQALADGFAGQAMGGDVAGHVDQVARRFDAASS